VYRPDWFTRFTVLFFVVGIGGLLWIQADHNLLSFPYCDIDTYHDEDYKVVTYSWEGEFGWRAYCGQYYTKPDIPDIFFLELGHNKDNLETVTVVGEAAAKNFMERYCPVHDNSK
jgi:hypothetical protein